MTLPADSSRPSRPSRRGVLGTALGLGAAAGLGAAGLPGPAFAAPARGSHRLRVATFNIHHGASPEDLLDLERTARVIAAMRPDVIGLQEVDRYWSDRSGGVDQAGWLGKRLGLHHVFAPNLDLDPAEPGRPRRQYGCALLSRFPILSSHHTLLPKAPAGEQRGLLQTVLNVRGTRVRAAVTHLTHNDDAERMDQAEAIRALLPHSPERTLMVGDLNATPDKPEIRRLTGALPDVWPMVGSGEGLTLPVLEPEVRIDYVLASTDVRPLSAHVLVTDREASDHLPVVSELLVPRR